MMNNVLVQCGFQADQRFVWNGSLLRELAAQPEVTHMTFDMWPIFSLSVFLLYFIRITLYFPHSFISLHFLLSMDVSFSLDS